VFICRRTLSSAIHGICRELNGFCQRASAIDKSQSPAHVKPGQRMPGSAMDREHQSDWNPTSAENRRDQRAAYDEMRQKCPVAHSEFFCWSLFRHEDVMRALLDHHTFSNTVSQHLTVPSGMDPPEHTADRQIIEPYFSEPRMRAFEPTCCELAPIVYCLAGLRIH
jgi:cytochrome P450